MDIKPLADNPTDRDHGFALRGNLLLVIAAAAAFWLLREAFAVLMPTVAALLLALAIWPLVAAIRDHVPRPLAWLGPLAGALAVLAILSAFFVGVGFAARSIYRLARDIGPQLGQRLGDLPFEMPGFINGADDPASQASSISGNLASGALTALNMTLGTLGGLVLILFLMLLMLGEAETWNAKLRTITDGRLDAQRWLDIGRSVGAKFRAYFTTRLLIGVMSGLLYAGLLFVFGVEYVLLWGMLTILLSFLPTVGSIISGILPTIYVFITRDAGDALIVGAGLLVIEQVLGNFVDPKLMGRRLAISPLVVLVSLVLWSLLWGIAGALLAVPLTVLVSVVMAQFDHLKPIALLMTQYEDFEALEEY